MLKTTLLTLAQMQDAQNHVNGRINIYTAALNTTEIEFPKNPDFSSFSPYGLQHYANLLKNYDRNKQILRAFNQFSKHINEAPAFDTVGDGALDYQGHILMDLIRSLKQLGEIEEITMLFEAIIFK